MRRFHRSLRWALVMNWGQRVIATLATFVLAGMLGPVEFGTVAMAMLFIGFLQLFLEQGLGAAIVQRAELEPEHLDAAFWMTAAWSLVLSIASAALGGWWARVNDLPALAPIVGALSIGLLAQGLAVVHEAVLERGLRFRRLALCSNVAALGGAAAAVALGLAGAGAWALVAQQLGGAVLWLVLVWAVSEWRPRPRFSQAHARPLLRFSLQVFTGNLGVYVSSRLDVLLIGLHVGAEAVGLYRLASRLVDTLLELTTRPVRQIALSHFSRLQRDPDALRAAVETCVHASCLLAVPALLVLAACSRQVVAVLGPAWMPAADALALLCLVGIGKAVVMFVGPTLQALAKPHLRTLAIWAMVTVSAPVLSQTAVALHAAPMHVQIVGMAAATAAVFLFLFVPGSVLLVIHAAGLRVRPLLSRLAPAFAAGAAAMAAAIAIRATGLLEAASPLLALVVSASIAAFAACAVLFLCDPALAASAREWLRAALRRGTTHDHSPRGALTPQAGAPSS